MKWTSFWCHKIDHLLKVFCRLFRNFEYCFRGPEGIADRGILLSRVLTSRVIIPPIIRFKALITRFKALIVIRFIMTQIQSTV